MTMESEEHSSSSGQEDNRACLPPRNRLEERNEELEREESPAIVIFLLGEVDGKENSSILRELRGERDLFHGQQLQHIFTPELTLNPLESILTFR